MSYNILILSVGRRVELVNSFKETAKKMNETIVLHGADIDRTAPALLFCDYQHIIKRIGQKGYINELIGLCLSHTVNLIIPTIDTELLLLSQNKDLIEKESTARILISPFKTISLFTNKISTHKILIEKGYLTPQLKDKTSFKDFPLFIKPVEGSSSKNAVKILNRDDLRYWSNKIERSLIQEFIEGDEFTVDIYTDFQSKFICAVPRLRLKTREGEISKGKVMKNPRIIELAKKICSDFKFMGPITLQLIKCKDKYYIIEINPRFGGGYPMSYLAGADYVQFIIKELKGIKLNEFDDYNDNMLFSRFDMTAQVEIDEND